MKITEDQQRLLDNLKYVRLTNDHTPKFHTLKGPEIKGEIKTHIIEHFISHEARKENLNRNLASYVIENKDGDILLMFSIRCGELFEYLDSDKLKIAKAALEAHKKFSDIENFSQLPLAEQQDIMNNIRTAEEHGLNIDDIEEFANKKIVS